MAKGNLLQRKRIERARQALEQGRLEEALPLYRQLCERNGSDPALWLDLGFVQGGLGRLSDAAESFRRAIALAPRQPQPHYNLGRALAGLGRWQEAAAAYAEAARLQPQWFEALADLGAALQRAGRPEASIEPLQRALQLNPEAADCRIDLAVALQAAGSEEEALAQLEKVLAENPGHPRARLLAAAVERRLGHLEKALDHTRHLHRTLPGHPAVALEEAHILERQGDWQGALERLRPLLDQPEPEAAAITLFARLCHHPGRCDEALERIERALASARTTPRARADLHFEAARLLDRAGRHDEAFDHARRANETAPGHFDPAAHEALIEAIVTLFDKPHFDHAPRAANRARPIFIVGMPRSGTTLVERILAAHPEVQARGELRLIDQLARQASERLAPGRGLPHGLDRLDGAALDQMAARYLEEAAMGEQAITDKMPQNFLHLGLIARLFPEARIVHCRRDPLDTCLSCYFQNFDAGQAFSKRLDHLAGYYLGYRRLMAHWREALPLELVEIDYETLVERPREEIGALLERLGLPWHDEVLHFHRAADDSATASYQQVRQPLYRHAVGRWKNYRRQLAPLIERLG